MNSIGQRRVPTGEGARFPSAPASGHRLNGYAGLVTRRYDLEHLEPGPIPAIVEIASYISLTCVDHARPTLETTSLDDAASRPVAIVLNHMSLPVGHMDDAEGIRSGAPRMIENARSTSCDRRSGRYHSRQTARLGGPHCKHTAGESGDPTASTPRANRGTPLQAHRGRTVRSPRAGGPRGGLAATPPPNAWARSTRPPQPRDDRPTTVRSRRGSSRGSTHNRGTY